MKRKYRIVYGEDREEVYIEPGYTIGTEGCQINITPDRDIAPVHARIIERGGDVIINAVHPDQYPITDSSGQSRNELVVEDGVQFRIGAVTFACSAATEIPAAAKPTKRRPGTNLLPPTETTPSLQKFFPHDHLYRIAVLGMPSSGKTCMLAALSMPRRARKDQITCIRRVWVRNDSPTNLTEADKEAFHSFNEGRGPLDEAVDQIMERKKPKKTPLDQSGRYVFDFSSPERKSMLVETIDYPGEYADPNMAADASARKIVDIMHQSDGIIILTQIPYPDEQRQEFDHLDRLAKTFSHVKRTNPVPVVIAVNKWDRVDCYDPHDVSIEKQEQHLAYALDGGTLEHLAALLQAVRNAVGTDNVRIVPMSSLGQCEFVEDPEEGGIVERPREVLPLHSFGLEDPFLWIMDRVDRLQVEEYRASVRALSVFPWKSLCGKAVTQLENHYTHLAARGITYKALLMQLRRARRRYTFKRRIAVCQILVFLVVALFVLEFAVSSSQYVIPARELTRLTSIVSHAAYDDTRGIEKQLQQYVDSHPFRHTVLAAFVPRQTAADRIKRSEHARVKLLLEHMQAQSLDLAVRYKAASKHKRDFPNDADSPREDVIALYRDNIYVIATNNTLPISSRSEAAEEFVTTFSDDVRVRQIRQITNELGRAQNIQQILTSSLAGPNPNFGRFMDEITSPAFREIDATMRGQIASNVLPALEGQLLSEVNRRVQNVTMSTMIGEISSFRSRLQPQTDLAVVNDFFGHALARLREAQSDHDLYVRAQRSGNIADANTYLRDSSIPGFMRVAVSNRLNSPLSGRLVLERINWHSDVPHIIGRKATASILINEQPSGTIPGIEAKGGQATNINQKGPQIGSLMPTNNIRLRIDLIVHGLGGSGQHSRYIANESVSIDDLRRSATLRAYIVGNRQSRKHSTVHIRLEHDNLLAEKWQGRAYRRLTGPDWN